MSAVARCANHPLVLIAVPAGTMQAAMSLVSLWFGVMRTHDTLAHCQLDRRRNGLIAPQASSRAGKSFAACAGLVGSVMLDHFGVLHARQPVDTLRVVGLLLVVAGATLVVRPWQSAGG